MDPLHNGSYFAISKKSPYIISPRFCLPSTAITNEISRASTAKSLFAGLQITEDDKAKIDDVFSLIHRSTPLPRAVLHHPFQNVRSNSSNYDPVSSQRHPHNRFAIVPISQHDSCSLYDESCGHPYQILSSKTTYQTEIYRDKEFPSQQQLYNHQQSKFCIEESSATQKSIVSFESHQDDQRLSEPNFSQIILSDAVSATSSTAQRQPMPAKGALAKEDDLLKVQNKLTASDNITPQLFEAEGKHQNANSISVSSQKSLVGSRAKKCKHRSSLELIKIIGKMQY
jgi:hypothetical protein